MNLPINYKTKTEILERDNLPCNSCYPIAIDVGYSGVKGMSPCNVFCFPSFARKETAAMIGNPESSDILYRDETGTYCVGEMAVNGLAVNDTNNSLTSLYGRNRYYSSIFKILVRVGIAIGLGQGIEGGWDATKPIFIQTGLPPAYRLSDTSYMIDAFSGKHVFQVKIGGGPWKNYNFVLENKDISVIDQPLGSVFSASKKNDGSTVILENGKSYIDSSLLVMDGGFGTLDIYSVANRRITDIHTYDTFGMKNVFDMTAKQISRTYGVETHVHTLPKLLDSGKVTVFDRATRSTREESFGTILDECSRKVCMNALSSIESTYNDLVDYEYLLVTGGTGAAWLDMIRDRYKGMSTLKIITGNQNDPNLDHIYNNVRGYYMRAVVTKRK